MLSGDMAREQIQDRVRAAAQDRRAAPVRRMRSPRVGSGMLAAFANVRLRRRSSERAPIQGRRIAV